MARRELILQSKPLDASWVSLPRTLSELTIVVRSTEHLRAAAARLAEAAFLEVECVSVYVETERAVGNLALLGRALPPARILRLGGHADDLCEILRLFRGSPIALTIDPAGYSRRPSYSCVVAAAALEHCSHLQSLRLGLSGFDVAATPLQAEKLARWIVEHPRLQHVVLDDPTERVNPEAFFMRLTAWKDGCVSLDSAPTRRQRDALYRALPISLWRDLRCNYELPLIGAASLARHLETLVLPDVDEESMTAMLIRSLLRPGIELVCEL